MNEEKCGNCWCMREQLCDDDGEMFGECHRYPPVFDRVMQVWERPVVMENDWCGEWKPVRKP